MKILERQGGWDFVFWGSFWRFGWVCFRVFLEGSQFLFATMLLLFVSCMAFES